MPHNEEEAGPQWVGAPPSQQRAWWPVHNFIEQLVAQSNYGPIPDAGTPSWQQLESGDPRKLLAVAVAGEHHVLRVETAQTELAEASHEISKAADWPQISRDIRQRSGVYIPREVA